MKPKQPTNQPVLVVIISSNVNLNQLLLGNFKPNLYSVHLGRLVSRTSLVATKFEFNP